MTMSRNSCYDEPVVLTLSSDEDDDDSSRNHSSCTHFLNEDQNFELKNSTVLEPINPKEPTVLPNLNYESHHLVHKNFPGCEKDTQAFLDENKMFLSMQCRSLRIGSYKVVPHDRVVLTYRGYEVSVPPFAQGDQSPVALLFHIKGIRKVLAHFGSSLPVIFIYVTDKLAAVIRHNLKMFDRNGFYFDPCSQEESQKRVTLLPEKMKQETVNVFKNMMKFESVDPQSGERSILFEELSLKDANEILVRSSPVEIESLALNSRTTVMYETRTLLIFPPPPNKGGITITMDDYCCLKDEQFLNDVLLDFYLKWLHTCHISEKDRDRTHIFSTFFYKRLTSKPKSAARRPPSSEDDPNLSPAQRRHSRVQSWTKNVDLFSKDFILIPINEQSHWFLAVICFPYLDGPVRVRDDVPIPVSEVTLPTRCSSRKKNKIEIPVIDDFDGSDRDEAEGDDNELVYEEEEEEEDDAGNEEEKPKRRLKTFLEEPIKQPCILILDSLTGSPRNRIVSTLRDYLSVEYMKRKNVEKKFTKETMMGTCPKVPQQMNYSDCGLFTLHFAQSFFERPLHDFRLPIRSLCSWFKQDEVTNKRESIANLIESLMDKYKPNHGITLPPIFTSSSSNCETTRHELTPTDKNSLNAHNDSKDVTTTTPSHENGDTTVKGEDKEKVTTAPEIQSESALESPAARTGCSSSIKYLFSLMGNKETPMDESSLAAGNDDDDENIGEGKRDSSPSLKENDIHVNNEGELRSKRRIESNSPDKVVFNEGVTESGGKVNSSLKLLCDSYGAENSDDEDIFLHSRPKRHKVTTIDL